MSKRLLFAIEKINMPINIKNTFYLLIKKAALVILFFAYIASSFAAVSFTSVTGEYTKIERVAGFPNVITDFFQNIPDCRGLADKNEDISLGGGLDKDSPCARLVSGGRFKNIWFMLWEAGGAAHHYEFFAFSLAGNDNKIHSLIHRDGLDGKAFLQSELVELLSNPPKCDPKEGYQHYQYKWEVNYGLCINENN